MTLFSRSHCQLYSSYRLRNDESVSITCLSFHLLKKDCIIFADKEGHIGSFDNTLPTSKLTNKNQDSGGYNDLSTNEDSLMEVSTCITQWLVTCA